MVDHNEDKGNPSIVDRSHQLALTFLTQHTIPTNGQHQHPIIRPLVFREHGCRPIIQLTTGWLLGQIQHWDNREHTPSSGYGHYPSTFEVISLFVSACRNTERDCPDHPRHLPQNYKNWRGRGGCPQLVVAVISRPFWRYSDLYLSPYFMPSQEPAFGPISDLRMPYRTHPHLPTIFTFPVSLWYYSHWHHLHNNYTIQYQHYHSPEASEHPSPLFNLDVQYPNFCLSVATCDFLFWTD